MAAPDEKRPKIAAEVRAWIGVGVVMAGYGWGMAWWAATISADIRSLRELVGELKAQVATVYTASDARRDLAKIEATLSDHEHRLRAVEAKR